LWILLALALLFALWHWRATFLSRVGTSLVEAQAPVNADAAVVLAGGFMGERIVKAAELVRDGYVPYAIMSGPKRFYEMSECDAAIPYATRKGFPAAYFSCAPNAAHSTQEEAQAILPELEKRGVHSILLVTSEYHTARAAKIWHRVAPGITVHTIAAPSPEFSIDRWYDNREGQKTVFSEWLKTVAVVLGL
jgi:uncharacterized SAM-binding protein YcdF (DUF218 family)